MTMTAIMRVVVVDQTVSSCFRAQVEVAFGNEAIDMITLRSQPQTDDDVIKMFIRKKIQVLEINRENLWRDALKAYKICMVDTLSLLKELMIEFVNEIKIGKC